MLDLEFVVLLVVRRGGVFKKARTDDPTPPTRRGEATNDPDDYTVYRVRRLSSEPWPFYTSAEPDHKQQTA